MEPGRKNWLFRYSVGQLLSASSSKLDYHEKRREWWDNSYRLAVEAAKGKGLEVREYAVTGGMQAQMIVDPSLQERIGTCASKRETHRQRAEQFREWVAVLESQPEGEVYELTMDDALYFGVAARPAED